MKAIYRLSWFSVLAHVTAIKPPQYAVYYPEAGGLIFSEIIGSGTQGTASLVYHLPTGRRLVRKASTGPLARTAEDVRNHPEVRNYRNHTYIPELIAANIDSALYEPATITVSKYCNGGNVRNFDMRHWWGKKLIYPEILIWQMLSHVLSALVHLHGSDPLVLHCDIHLGNVFIDWISSSSLPDFYLGDFGATHDFSSSLYTSTTNTILSSSISKALAIEYRALGLSATDLMQEGVNWPSKANWSPEIGSLLRSMGVDKEPEFRTWKEWEKYTDALRNTIGDRLAYMKEKESVLDHQWIVPTNGPLLFDSAEGLLEHVKHNCPPGSWRIAKVLGSDTTFALLEISNELYGKASGYCDRLDQPAWKAWARKVVYALTI